MEEGLCRAGKGERSLSGGGRGSTLGGTEGLFGEGLRGVGPWQVVGQREGILGAGGPK